VSASRMDLDPTHLGPGNYQTYATRYGVTGSVTPPPDEIVETIAHPDNKKLAPGIGEVFSSYNIRIPDGYTAVSGFIQSVNFQYAGSEPTAWNWLEFFIGKDNFFKFGNAPDSTDGALNTFFRMNGETGDVPVTFRTCSPLVEFSYAIGINCKRTEKAYEQWQLKTHATIMAGYQRQLAAYEDKLAQYRAVVRGQVSQAQNFAHDPSIEQEELKKAFIALLLSEQFSQAYRATPNPLAFPPDPTAVTEWGAMVAFFERAFEWENLMYTYYPYFWGRQTSWGELILIQDMNPQFEAFLKAGAARVVIPVRPGFEAALAHFQETGDIWMGKEMPDMFSDYYVSIIDEIKARNAAPGQEVLVEEWDVKLPTTLVMLKEDTTHLHGRSSRLGELAIGAQHERSRRFTSREIGWPSAGSQQAQDVVLRDPAAPPQPGPVPPGPLRPAGSLARSDFRAGIARSLSRPVRPSARPGPCLPRQPAIGVDG
jgi:hypothetical protein